MPTKTLGNHFGEEKFDLQGIGNKVFGAAVSSLFPCVENTATCAEHLAKLGKASLSFYNCHFLHNQVSHKNNQSSLGLHLGSQQCAFREPVALESMQTGPRSTFKIALFHSTLRLYAPLPSHDLHRIFLFSMCRELREAAQCSLRAGLQQ